jgi:outer membrane protein OmpA-like peptidoglycan-associated protein
MSSIKKTFLIATCAVVNYYMPVAMAQQAVTKEAPAPVPSVAEPLGDAYKVPKALPIGVSRLTVYRPAVGFGVGVASLMVNDHYHTSLQLGSYTHICLKPTKPASLESRLVETGTPVKTEVDIKTSVPLKEGQEVFVRLADQGNGRATIDVVAAEAAQNELKPTRLQVHAVSRVAEAVSCEVPEVPAPAAALVAHQPPKKLETITLASDALFGFGKSDAQAIPPKGRASLDKLIAHLIKKYGTFEQTQIQVTGYADPLGNPVSNQRLSEARAQAIKGYMVEGGIPSTKIAGDGRGATDLIVTNCAAVATPASIECNKPNRRVVVTVLVTEQR